MNFISGVFRFILRQYKSLFSFLRIVRLKLLYPGITIDFNSTIERNCSIVCVKGGKLNISNSKISYGTTITADSASIISITNSFIGINCVITSKEKVTIHKNCLIAEMVVIRDQDHITDKNEKENKWQKYKAAAIEIEENTWVASKATILKGVHIGKFSVIAASAVVTKNVPAYQVWGGVPAKFIKEVAIKNQ